MSFRTKRFILLAASVLAIGLGIALFRWSDLGNDPISALELAIAARLGTTFGNVVLVGNLLMFIPVLFCHRQSIGVGTLLNMTCCGYASDLFTRLFEAVSLPAAETLPLQLVFVLVGVLELSLAVSLYFTVGLGIAPYDTMAFIIEKYTGIHFSKCRIFTDCLCAAGALALGGIVNVGTFVSAFCMGPFIHFFNEKVSMPLLGAKPAAKPTGE